VELKSALDGVPQDDPRLDPWRQRLIELEIEPDEVDHLLAEVEAQFEGADEAPPAALELAPQIDMILRMLGAPEDEEEEPQHRVRTVEGTVIEGTWEEIVARMRDHSADPSLPVATFMRRTARQVRERTGRELPCDTPEAFVRAGARLGLLRIEQ
jgi:hypothetical protein